MHRLISVPSVRGEVRSSPAEQQTVAEPLGKAANVSLHRQMRITLPSRKSRHPLAPPLRRVSKLVTPVSPRTLKDLRWGAVGGRDGGGLGNEKGEKENREQMCVCVGGGCGCVSGGRRCRGGEMGGTDRNTLTIGSGVVMSFMASRASHYFRWPNKHLTPV